MKKCDFVPGCDRAGFDGAALVGFGGRCFASSCRAFRGFVAALCLVLAAPALAQPQSFIDTASGIEMVRITHPGNAPWTGGGSNNNRGQVNHIYSIGKFEVTTAQWAEFMNAALDRPASDAIPHVVAPFGWGAVGTTPNNPGRPRFAVPAGNEMIPTGGITWRTAAIYCNWLHNGKATNREAFLSGAYDVSTFGYIGEGGGFTDQLTRSEGALYWIPSLDEWMKAAHWDPNRNGENQPGWWMFPHASDQPLAYGPPGVNVQPGFGPHGPNPDGPLAQANAGWNSFNFPGFNPYTIPLGAYPDVKSPWGLLDVAGATSEWTEGFFQTGGDIYPSGRIYEGTGWGVPVFMGNADRVRARAGSEFPSAPFSDFGFRIASSVPAPGLGSLGLGFVLVGLVHRRRRGHEEMSWNSHRQVAPKSVHCMISELPWLVAVQQRQRLAVCLRPARRGAGQRRVLKPQPVHHPPWRVPGGSEPVGPPRYGGRDKGMDREQSWPDQALVPPAGEYRNAAAA